MRCGNNLNHLDQRRIIGVDDPSVAAICDTVVVFIVHHPIMR